MTRTCGECPWMGDVWIGAEPGDVHKCKASLDVRWVDMDDPVCPARHAFEVLRDEVRRLRKKNGRLRRDIRSALDAIDKDDIVWAGIELIEVEHEVKP